MGFFYDQSHIKDLAVSDSKLRWGIIGAGAIADAFVRGVQMGKTGRVVAVASRSLDKAKKFGTPFGIERSHGSYEALLADDEIDAVYIATPHPMHPVWAIRAAEAGKHVLCEKPLGLNTAQAMAMIEAAREHNVFLMEAFMYRCNPQTARLIELIKERVIGDVRVVQASFGFNAAFNPESRAFNNALAGGGIMDVGCYPVSMARLIAGAVDGKPFRDPVSVSGEGVLAETGVDAYTAAVLRFDNGIIAQVATGVQAGLENNAVIIGSEGKLVLPDPWTLSRTEPRDGVIEIHKDGQVRCLDIPVARTSFSYEADYAAEAIAAGRQQPEAPAMLWDDSLGNLMALDRWRESVGVNFEGETARAQGKLTVAGRPLQRRANHNMRYLRIDGIEKDISCMLMGCDNQQTYAHSAVLFDDWFERGGNAFDTAHLYHGGKQERFLGQWMEARGVRDQVVILSKGGHPPFNQPEAITTQLTESLERLRTDHVELYILHRDNTDVPVGEFVDVLSEHAEAGRIKVFGGSNWSIDRVAEANAYAKKNGKQGFGVMSNNLSLAEMVKPVWPGCVHVSDTTSRQWLGEQNMPNFAWSSQARGYFLPEALRMRLGRDNFISWDSPANQARRQRAHELAKQLGVSPINIAAAYVLSQPFPSFALIGPRTVHETVTSLPALDIQLTQQQIDWLWSGK